MKRILLILTVALITIAMVVITSMPAFAAITCQNPGGQSPQGNCQGANQNVNPAGHAPPGQNL